MIGIIFNHDMYDEPYKQSSVQKGFKKLEDLCKNLNEQLFISFSDVKRNELFDKDFTDEYIIVHYSGELTDSQKAEIADCIKEILALKKTTYNEDELPKILIIFSHVNPSDCFCFNVK